MRRGRWHAAQAVSLQRCFPQSERSYWPQVTRWPPPRTDSPKGTRCSLPKGWPRVTHWWAQQDWSQALAQRDWREALAQSSRLEWWRPAQLEHTRRAPRAAGVTTPALQRLHAWQHLTSEEFQRLHRQLLRQSIGLKAELQDTVANLPLYAL